MAKKKTSKTETKKKPHAKASARPDGTKSRGKRLAQTPTATPPRASEKSAVAKVPGAEDRGRVKPTSELPRKAREGHADGKKAEKAPRLHADGKKAEKAPRLHADGNGMDAPTTNSESVLRIPTRKLPSQDLRRIRAALSEKKQAISNHLQSELRELEKPEKRHRADLEEMASDTHDTDSLCVIMDLEANQIDQINLALAKLDNGTYGVCEDCGQEIPLPRLEALPFATQCIACKRKAEIQGQIAALE